MSGRSKPPWTACCQNDTRSALPTDSHTSPPPSLTSGGNDEHETEHRRLKSGPPLMRGLKVHKNIPVSITKLTLCLRVGFISSHLIADKLIPVNPRAITGPPKMGLLLEAKSMPALIIKPRFILVTHPDDLGWYITSNQQGKMFVQNLNRIVRKPNVTPRQLPYCTTDSIPIYFMFQGNFPTHTQV